MAEKPQKPFKIRLVKRVVFTSGGVITHEYEVGHIFIAYSKMDQGYYTCNAPGGIWDDEAEVVEDDESL